MEKTNSMNDLTQEEWEKFQEVPDESFQSSASDNISKSEEVLLLYQLSKNNPKFSKWGSTDSILARRLPDSKLPKMKEK